MMRARGREWVRENLALYPLNSGISLSKKLGAELNRTVPDR